MIGDSAVEKTVDGVDFTFKALSLDQFTYYETAKKNVRLHSRKAKLILESLHLLNFNEFKRDFSPLEIGLYINAHQNVLDFDLPGLAEKNDESIYQHYKKILTPTYNVKNSTGILPGHICIFHELNGPSFAMSSIAASQVFSKAAMDLKMGLVKCAVVCLVNTYDDPVALKIHSRLAGTKVLNEACAVYLVTKESFLPTEFYDSKNYFGHVDGLINTENQ